MLNKVQIIGRLGKDPELKYTPSGQPVVNFSVATTERYKDQNGHAQEITEWHNIVVWGKQAENCAKYLSKGKLAFLEGKIRTRSYDDKATNQKKYITEIVTSQVLFLSPSDSQPNNQQGQYQYQQPQAQYQQPQVQKSSNQQYTQGNIGVQQNSPEHHANPGLDDIPF